MNTNHKKKEEKQKKTQKHMEKPKYNVWQNCVFMIKLAWKKQKSVIWICFILWIVRTFANILDLFTVPTILKRIEVKSSLEELLFTILFFTLGMIFCRAIIAYANTNTMFGRVRIRSCIVNMLHTKLCSTSYPNIEDTSFIKKYDKAKMATNDNREATEAIWEIMTNTVFDITCFAICISLLTALNPLLMLISLATTLLGYFVNNKINEWGYRHRDEESEYSKRMNYITSESENITLAKDVRIFGMRSWLEEIYSKTMRLYRAFVLRGEKVYIWTNVLDLVLSFLRNAVIYAYLIGLTLRQQLPASEFLLYFSAINGFTERIGYILWNLSTLHKHSLSICNVREFLEAPEPFKFEEGEEIQPVNGKDYEICLEDVSYRYPSSEKNTLSHINITIHPGEKLAIVGLNGAGKTTLIKLICGFLDPTEGRVLLNGTDIRIYNRRDYYLHFTAVFQQFSLLEAPIEVNISQETKNIDHKKVLDCLEKAGMTEKINSLKDGVNTPLGKKVFEDGIELSGGQMQRIMLARALYKNSPIIVLDEPTAALDPIAESDMYQKYCSFTEGKTSIYISHRLASTRFCDRIIYLESGEVKEEGTHVSLLKQGKKYSELYEIQSKYYKEGVETDEKAE